jgi:hypothetical protein
MRKPSSLVRFEHYPQTDWQKLESMTDEEIDYSDIPPLDDDFFARATLRDVERNNRPNV